jgi:glycosyltransferase involved in cell wall biosynthesis
MDDRQPSILMFAPLCYPPAGSEAIVTAKLVLAMIEAGWKIKVITQADFGHYYPTSDNDQWSPIHSVIKNISGINEKGIIARLFGSALPSRVRTLSWIVKAVFAGIVNAKREKYDFILSRVAPQYGHLPALIVSRIMRIPWIANWSDPMPPQKAPPPYGGGLHAKVSLLSAIYYRAIFRIADWHTFPCERLMRYYWQIYPDLETKSSVIPHIALKRFCILQSDKKNVFSLCHTGSVTLRDPAIFFAGLKLFLAEYKPTEAVKVIFIGHPCDEIQAKVQEAGVGEIVSISMPKTYEVTQCIAAASSILVVIEAQCEEGIFFPSKFVDFVQTGRPILAVSPKVGTLSDILSTHGGGIAVDCSSPEAVAEALNTLYKEWRNGDIEDKHGSKRLYNLFSEDNVLNSYVKLFDRLDIMSAHNY